MPAAPASVLAAEDVEVEEAAGGQYADDALESV